MKCVTFWLDEGEKEATSCISGDGSCAVIIGCGLTGSPEKVSLSRKEELTLSNPRGEAVHLWADAGADCKLPSATFSRTSRQS